MTSTNDNSTPKTLKELRKWMKQECFNGNSYSVGDMPAPADGFVLWLNGHTFEWYYTERGGRDVIETFTDEEKACQYAFEQMTHDKTARSHMVGFFKEKNLQIKLCRELEGRGISFDTDKIPYDIDSPRFRVFVYGCDYKKVEDLKEKYFKLDPKARWTKS